MAFRLKQQAMPAESTEIQRSIRRWLRVVAFTLGVGLVGLANIGYLVASYQEGLFFAITGLAGAVVALVAGLKIIGDLFPASSKRDDRVDSES